MKIEMIDISEKDRVKRIAIASGKIKLNRETIKGIKENKIKKGDPLAVSEISSINAIKQTANLIPLCHQIPVDNIDIKYNTNLMKISLK